MSYAYGMKGSPAVGNGLPGLPRRGIALERRPSSIDLSRYYTVSTYGIYGASTAIYIKNLGTGETVKVIPPGMGTNTSQSGFKHLNVSEDGKYLVLCTSPPSNEGSSRIHLYSLPDGTLLSSVTPPYGTATGDRAGKAVAINSEKGLIAISASTGTNYHLIFTIDEFLKGGSYQNLNYTTIPNSFSFNSRASARSLEINHQGNLLLFSSSETSQNITQLIDIDTKSLIGNITDESGSNQASINLNFSPDGRMFCVNFASETRLFSVNYDSSGKYISHTPVFTYQREGGASVVSSLEGKIIFPYVARTKSGVFGLEHKVRLYDPYTLELIADVPSGLGTYENDDSRYLMSGDGYVLGVYNSRNFEYLIPTSLSKNYSPEQSLIKKISLDGLGGVDINNIRLFGTYYG